MPCCIISTSSGGTSTKTQPFAGNKVPGPVATLEETSLSRNRPWDFALLDTSLVTILINSGAIGVMLILFLIGAIVPKSHLKEKQKECDELKIQRDLERQRADVAVQNSLTGLQVMQALRDVAYDRRPPWQQLDSPPEHYSVFPPAQGPSHGEGANPH